MVNKKAVKTLSLVLLVLALLPGCKDWRDGFRKDRKCFCKLYQNGARVGSAEVLIERRLDCGYHGKVVSGRLPIYFQCDYPSLTGDEVKDL